MKTWTRVLEEEQIGGHIYLAPWRIEKRHEMLMWSLSYIEALDTVWASELTLAVACIALAIQSHWKQLVQLICCVTVDVFLKPAAVNPDIFL